MSGDLAGLCPDPNVRSPPKAGNPRGDHECRLRSVRQEGWGDRNGSLCAICDLHLDVGLTRAEIRNRPFRLRPNYPKY